MRSGRIVMTASVQPAVLAFIRCVHIRDRHERLPVLRVGPGGPGRAGGRRGAGLFPRRPLADFRPHAVEISLFFGRERFATPEFLHELAAALDVDGALSLADKRTDTLASKSTPVAVARMVFIWSCSPCSHPTSPAARPSPGNWSSCTADCGSACTSGPTWDCRSACRPRSRRGPRRRSRPGSRP